MTFIIHFDLSDNSEDSIVVTGDTLEECQARAAIEIEKRGGLNPWSEQVLP